MMSVCMTCPKHVPSNNSRNVGLLWCDRRISNLGGDSNSAVGSPLTGTSFRRDNFDFPFGQVNAIIV